ncbi:hypothetical protein ACP4OV_016472 [Aristida adscensionis]
MWWRGGAGEDGGDGGGARVAVDGEVHVQRVEKIVEPAMPMPTPNRGVVSPPPPAKAGRGHLVTVAIGGGGGGGKAARDVNELAEEFIRRNRAAFQGIGAQNKAVNV